MDNGQGKFIYNDETDPTEKELKKAVMEAMNPNHGGWFREGEIIEIRGSRFRISSVKPTQLRLKLLIKKGDTDE